eukprot:919321_1
MSVWLWRSGCTLYCLWHSLLAMHAILALGAGDAYGGVGVLNENIRTQKLAAVLASKSNEKETQKRIGITNCIKRGRFDCGIDSKSQCVMTCDAKYIIILGGAHSDDIWITTYTRTKQWR